jgi:Fe-S-cluster containining protein
MRDGLGRRTLKALALGWFYAALGVDRLLARATRRAPYLLGGDCRRCAACCESPAIRVGWLIWSLPLLERVFLSWQRHVNRFDLRDRDPETRVYIFRCLHFDWVTRRCDSYASRPGVCRDYPRALLHQPHPELLRGCGYRPIARNAKRFLHVLDAQSLTDEQRARLKKDLFLE